jgi:hypothetical protein
VRSTWGAQTRPQQRRVRALVRLLPHLRSATGSRLRFIRQLLNMQLSENFTPFTRPESDATVCRKRKMRDLAPGKTAFRG